jgi:phosphate-selective porin OprO/OprP
MWMAGLRLTALPLYENGGRDWLHLGAALGWRNGITGNTAGPVLNSGTRTWVLRARPELRDDDPAGQQLPNDSSSVRLVTTGTLAVQNVYILGTEFCWVRGPFSVQAEGGWQFLEGVRGVGPTATAFAAPGGTTNYSFYGGYVQLAYTLTGEARGYDRAGGTLSRQYFGGPNYTNAWFLRRNGGGLTSGWGAWEIAARYGYNDLNDRDGRFRIQGGTLNTVAVALNWYLNPNMSLMFDWISGTRDNVPGQIGTGGGTNALTLPGTVNGFGIRTQISF